MVVIRPCSTPNASSSTLTIGTKQFVVQLALETTLCCLGSKSVWLTPYTNVASAPSLGEDTMTSGAPGLEVGAGLRLGGEDAGRLDDDVDAEVAPRQLGRVALGQHPQLVAVDRDAGLRGLTLLGRMPRTESYLSRWAIVGSVAEVVDGDEVDVGTGGLGGPEEVAADPAEAVDSNTDGHQWGSFA